MPDFTDVMVDIETSGVRPDVNAVIQISAVKFNLATGEVDTNFFNKCLSIPTTRHWDEGTRQWWAKRPDVLRGIYARMENPRKVMEELYWWAGGPSCGLAFWSKPLSFDFPFVASYLTDFGPATCFPFWKARDLRSFIAGLTFPDAPFNDREVPFEGTEHDAIFDTLHQIKILFEAIKAAKTCTSSTLMATALDYSETPILDGAS